MVYPTLKTLLFTRHLFEATFGTSGAGGLVGLTRRVSAHTLGFQVIARVGVAIGIGGEIDKRPCGRDCKNV